MMEGGRRVTRKFDSEMIDPLMLNSMADDDLFVNE